MQMSVEEILELSGVRVKFARNFCVPSRQTALSLAMRGRMLAHSTHISEMDELKVITQKNTLHNNSIDYFK